MCKLIVYVCDMTSTVSDVLFTAFCVRHRRGEMYSDHSRMCVCLSLAAFPYYCHLTWGNGKGVS